MDVAVDEPLDTAAEVAAGEEVAVLDEAVAAVSFFSPVLVPSVLPAVPDGGLSLSE